MKRQVGIEIRVIAVVLAAGLLIWLQPVNWIETLVGINPDGGNGFLELLLAMVPIVAGLAFAIPALSRPREAGPQQ